MLNRFKSALYGSSKVDDPQSMQYDHHAPMTSFERASIYATGPLGRGGDKSRRPDLHNNGDIDGVNQLSAEARRLRQGQGGSPTTKFNYTRPEFLQLKEVLIGVSADHQIRPILLPHDGSRLPWRSGFAECINAGKSMLNEDQATVYRGVASLKTQHQAHNCQTHSSTNISGGAEIPWVYFGTFDGHGGPEVAVAAAAQLHGMIEEKLNQIAELLFSLELDFHKPEDVEDEFYTECASSPSGESTIKLASANANRKAPSQNCNQEDEISTAPKQEKDKSVNGTSLVLAESELLEGPAAPGVLEPKEGETCSHPDKLLTKSKKVSNELAQPCTTTTELQSPSPQADQLTSAFDRKSKSVSFNVERLTRLPSMIDICRNNITVESLIIGVLESAFWEMDALIGRDKRDYKMPGGCTAIVSLFILGNLYVCNAGDSRAIVCKGDRVIEMSFDFTPLSDLDRILRLGMQRPDYLGAHFTHLEFPRRVSKMDLGTVMLYRDAYMSGWSLKEITQEDLKIPLVWGDGKRARVMAILNVSRGFGDHELRSYGSTLVKPFLTPEPEVKLLRLEHDETLTTDDVLIMGSDGLWDVISNEEASRIVKNSFDQYPEDQFREVRYITAAQELVLNSRGNSNEGNDVWRRSSEGDSGGEDDQLASWDDIGVFVIPLKQYRDEYVEWKKKTLSQRQTASVK